MTGRWSEGRPNCMHLWAPCMVTVKLHDGKPSESVRYKVCINCRKVLA